MRKSLVRTSLLCGALAMLSGCYSNGKFHSPTWSDMAWWKKDKAPDTSLAAAPSVGKPSNEALADKNSPGAKATAAPPYEAATASYNTPPAGADSRYPDTGYPNTGYPDAGYGAPGASSGGANWAANGNAAASVASNPYAKSGGGYDAGNRYDTGSRYDAPAAASGAAQTSPYDSNYPGAASSSAAPSYASPSTGYDSGRYGSPNANGQGGNYGAPSGSYDNPHYRSADPNAPSAAPRYDEGRYTAPDRYAPPANTGATNDKYTAPNYATPEDAARRYDAGGYRDMTGDRYQTDSRSSAATAPAAAAPSESRTADSRNAAPRTDSNAYNPGATGYQPSGVPSYSNSVDNRATSAAPAYQPGGTSRYEGPASSTAAGNANRTDSTTYGTNPYAAEPRPENRYQEPPLNSREGAARY